MSEFAIWQIKHFVSVALSCLAIMLLICLDIYEFGYLLQNWPDIFLICDIYLMISVCWNCDCQAVNGLIEVAVSYTGMYTYIVAIIFDKM